MKGVSRFGVDPHAVPVAWRTLDWREPSAWPRGLRLALVLAVGVSLGLLGGWLWPVEIERQGERQQAQEQQLRADYRNKREMARDLEALRLQLQQVEQDMDRLAQALPRQDDMDQLLSSLHQTAARHALSIDAFLPGAAQTFEAYQGQPIAMRVRGGYPAIMAFVAGVSRMPRVVVLKDMKVSRGADAADARLLLEATAWVYRERDALPAAAAAGLANGGGA